MEEIINNVVPYPVNEMDDYEARYHLKELHDSLLEIMLEFDAFCRKNDIHYSIADGTLMGALRHGDFIPWDDDADVMVTRTEYEKIMKAIRNEDNLKFLKITFLDRITTEKYKSQKIYIDLFINEDMPASRFVFKWKKFKTALLRNYFENNMRNVRHDNYSNLKHICYNILRSVLGYLVRLFVGKRDIFELNDKAVAIGSHKMSGIYTRYTSRMYETKRRFNKDSYEAGYADVAFRGVKLMALKSSDTFLREMYGDYMKLLPEEKRVPEHATNMMDSTGRRVKWLN